MQAQWKQKCENCNSDACIFVPGSTVNEGRNALWSELLRLYPGTVFTYIIILDGEHRLSFRPQHMQTQHAFLEQLETVPHPRRPYFVWEQVLQCSHCFPVWLTRFADAFGVSTCLRCDISHPLHLPPSRVFLFCLCHVYATNSASPAFNLWGNVQSDLEVQFISNFDHIMVRS